MWSTPAVLQCTTNPSSPDASTDITYLHNSRTCLQKVSLILLPHLSPLIDRAPVKYQVVFVQIKTPSAQVRLAHKKPFDRYQVLAGGPTLVPYQVRGNRVLEKESCIYILLYSNTGSLLPVSEMIFLCCLTRRFTICRTLPSYYLSSTGIFLSIVFHLYRRYDSFPDHCRLQHGECVFLSFGWTIVYGSPRPRD